MVHVYVQISLYTRALGWLKLMLKAIVYHIIF